MGMKNDISFLITDVLNLYEHQSTFSPNMPLRGLLYFARLYQKMVGNEKKIYSGKLIELPYPQFIVFYNGTAKEPERMELKLKLKREDIVLVLVEDFDISEDEATEYIEKYWVQT